MRLALLPAGRQRLLRHCGQSAGSTMVMTATTGRRRPGGVHPEAGPLATEVANCVGGVMTPPSKPTSCRARDHRRHSLLAGLGRDQPAPPGPAGQRLGVAAVAPRRDRRPLVLLGLPPVLRQLHPADQLMHPGEQRPAAHPPQLLGIADLHQLGPRPASRLVEGCAVPVIGQVCLIRHQHIHPGRPVCPSSVLCTKPRIHCSS